MDENEIRYQNNIPTKKERRNLRKRKMKISGREKNNWIRLRVLWDPENQSPPFLFCQGSLSSLIGSISHFLAPEAKRERGRESSERVAEVKRRAEIASSKWDWGFACDGAEPFNRHCRFHLIQNPLNSAVSVSIYHVRLYWFWFCFSSSFWWFLFKVGPGLSVWLVVAATYRRIIVVTRPVRGGRSDRYIELILFLVFSLAIALVGYKCFVSEAACLTWLRK